MKEQESLGQTQYKWENSKLKHSCIILTIILNDNGLNIPLKIIRLSKKMNFFYKYIRH